MGYTVDFEPLGRRVPLEEGETLLEAASRLMLADDGTVYAPCGGEGSCGRCVLRLVEGEANPPTEKEVAKLGRERLSESFRLACQVRPTSSVKAVIPPEALAGRQNLQVEGEEVKVTPDWRGRTCQGGRPPLGLAVDLGTTKIAAYLVDLASGRTMASDALMNPQIPWGEDLMSRLNHALTGEGGMERLGSLAAGGIGRLLDGLLLRTGSAGECVKSVTVAANTAMHHLLAGLSVDRLARAPFAPERRGAIALNARSLGLDAAPDAELYLVPPVGGFVGGDHVAMILGADIPSETGVTLGIDIGTNTEIVLASNGRLSSCSCASGPAFEGAHLKQGMRAVEGAVCSVLLEGNGTKVRLETVGAKPPVGLCGSGALDALAQLVLNEVVDSRGRLDRAHPRVEAGEDGCRFVLARAGEGGAPGEIFLTQRDIGELQLAKAAIAAGIEMLLASEGVEPDAIGKVVVAGAFGTHLRVESALSIGMFPDLPSNRFRQVGNAAGTGARMILLNSGAKRAAEELAEKITHLELTGHTGFNGAFARALRFPIKF